MKASLMLLLLIVVGSFAVGCKAPDQISPKDNDSTSKMNKQAGGDE